MYRIQQRTIFWKAIDHLNKISALSCLTVLVLILSVASPASAEQITFIYNGMGSGTIGNTQFGDIDNPVAFTITAMSNTNLWQPFIQNNFWNSDWYGWGAEHLTASISIEGISGDFSIDTATQTLVYKFRTPIGEPENKTFAHMGQFAGMESPISIGSTTDSSI